MSDHTHGLPGWICNGVGVVLGAAAGLTAQPWVIRLTCTSLVVGILYHVAVGACHVARTWSDLRKPKRPVSTPARPGSRCGRN